MWSVTMQLRLIDDAEYGNNCGCGPVTCGVLREF